MADTPERGRAHVTEYIRQHQQFLCSDPDRFFREAPVALFWVDEAAQILDVGRDAIYAGLHAGTFPHVPVGERKKLISGQVLMWMVKGLEPSRLQALLERLAEEAFRAAAGLPAPSEDQEVDGG